MVIFCVNEVLKNYMKRLIYVVVVKCMNGIYNFLKIYIDVSFLNILLCFFFFINKIIILLLL